MSTATETTIDTLNSLLRGELSAVATYRQAEHKFAGRPEADELRRIGEEHRQAAESLREEVERWGGQASAHSGAWGALATLVEGAAKLFGDTAALRALKEGEEQGIDDYESALDNPELPPECHSLIAGTLLPRCRAHLLALDGLMARD